MSLCAQCKRVEATHRCGGPCVQLLYCSQGCANAAYPEHQRRCVPPDLRRVLSYERLVRNNTEAKQLIFRTDPMAGYAMYLKPGEEIGAERHPDATQFFYVLSGKGVATIEGQSELLSPGKGVDVEPGQKHNIRANPGGEGLHLLTLYAPAEHHTIELGK